MKVFTLVINFAGVLLERRVRNVAVLLRRNARSILPLVDVPLPPRRHPPAGRHCPHPVLPDARPREANRQPPNRDNLRGVGRGRQSGQRHLRALQSRREWSGWAGRVSVLSLLFQVGPAGSQFGLLACLIVEVLNSWPILKHPNQALCKLLSITLALFLIGLLPWVDNYAHLFGFVFGFLLSYALLPFISFGVYERRKKIALIWVCLLSAGFLFSCLVLLFYIIPVYDCKICSYFNCIPFTRDFCASQNINFKREEPIV
jgi:hypothetical protein